jgi:cytochrome P450
VLAFTRDRLGFLTHIAREHGDIVHWTMGREHMVLLVHPEHIRDVLVTHQRRFRKGRGLERAKMLLGEGLLTSEGEFHLRQRRLAQPAFHRQRIAGYGRVMTDFAVRAAGRWREGDTIDVAHEMTRLTLAVVGKTLFDADVEAEATEIGDALTQSIESFTFTMLPFGEILERLPLPPVRRFERARERLDRTIYRMIDERRRSGSDRGDLLSMLMLARDDEAPGLPDEGSASSTGDRMTDRQLRDEAMTIFLAGHETTANALAWTLYLLANHPDVERRLHAELDDVLGDRPPAADDITALAFTRMVVAESMRLYPPAWVIGRRAMEDYDVGGYRLPARSIVLVSPFITHRDARFFPDPESFRPDRWTPEAQAAQPKFAYFPFGGGTRQCIGEQFAWMEAILILAALTRRHRFRLVNAEPVTPRAIVTLRPRGRMMMRVERRGVGSGR